MHKIFEFLNEKDLYNSDNFSRILSWSDAELTDFVNEIEELNLNEKENNKSLFSFSANKELSSGMHSCSYLNCRQKNIKKLAQFAVLYSDNLFIYNPFEDYFLIKDWEDDLKQKLHDDLIILDYLSPLINKGIIRFSKSQESMCELCYSELFKKFEIILDTIEQTIMDTTEFTVIKECDELLIEATSSPDYWGHATTYMHIKNSNKLKKYLLHTDKYELKRTDLKKLKIVSRRAEEILLDLIQQNANVKTLNNNYLFTNNYYPQIVNKINRYNPNVLSPYDIAEGLTHVVPAIENTSLHNLINLRENDFESFLVYRDSIRKLISQTIEINDFSNLSMAINDIVRPEINKMNLAVKTNKKMLSYKTRKELLISAGIITLGVFSGILPYDISKIIGVIGGCKFAQTIISQAIDISNPQYNIANNDYYFIWKIQQNN